VVLKRKEKSTAYKLADRGGDQNRLHLGTPDMHPAAIISI
jgi:hypothetical protein